MRAVQDTRVEFQYVRIEYFLKFQFEGSPVQMRVIQDTRVEFQKPRVYFQKTRVEIQIQCLNYKYKEKVAASLIQEFSWGLDCKKQGLIFY